MRLEAVVAKERVAEERGAHVEAEEKPPLDSAKELSVIRLHLSDLCHLRGQELLFRAFAVDE